MIGYYPRWTAASSLMAAASTGSEWWDTTSYWGGATTARGRGTSQRTAGNTPNSGKFVCLCIIMYHYVSIYYFLFVYLLIYTYTGTWISNLWTSLSQGTLFTYAIIASGHQLVLCLGCWQVSVPGRAKVALSGLPAASSPAGSTDDLELSCALKTPWFFSVLNSIIRHDFAG